jgi:hypothetical protein
MANSNFVVQNGLTVGPLTIDAATGSISTTGTVTVTGGLAVSAISQNDSSISISDTGAGSNVRIIIDGVTEHTLTSTLTTLDGALTTTGNVVAGSGTTSTTTTTGALVVVGGAGVSGNLTVGGSFFQGTLPSVLNDISPQFDSAKTVFALRLDQTNINNIMNSADVEVVVNGRRLVPYVTELRYPWLTPYDSYRGYRVSSGSNGNLIIYNAPETGDQAMVTIVSTSAAVQTRRYPYSATTIAFGD